MDESAPKINTDDSQIIEAEFREVPVDSTDESAIHINIAPSSADSPTALVPYTGNALSAQTTEQGLVAASGEQANGLALNDEVGGSAEDTNNPLPQQAINFSRWDELAAVRQRTGEARRAIDQVEARVSTTQAQWFGRLAVPASLGGFKVNRKALKQWHADPNPTSGPRHLYNTATTGRTAAERRPDHLELLGELQAAYTSALQASNQQYDQQLAAVNRRVYQNADQNAELTKDEATQWLTTLQRGVAEAGALAHTEGRNIAAVMRTMRGYYMEGTPNNGPAILGDKERGVVSAIEQLIDPAQPDGLRNFAWGAEVKNLLKGVSETERPLVQQALQYKVTEVLQAYAVHNPDMSDDAFANLIRTVRDTFGVAPEAVTAMRSTLDEFRLIQQRQPFSVPAWAHERVVADTVLLSQAQEIWTNGIGGANDPETKRRVVNRILTQVTPRSARALRQHLGI